MPIAKLDKLADFDIARKIQPWEKRHVEGKKLRTSVPRESHAKWQPPKNRPNPIKTVMATNRGRQTELIPLRMGRMAASPFARSSNGKRGGPVSASHAGKVYRRRFVSTRLAATLLADG